MRISVLTLFPEMLAPLKASLLGKATAAGLFELCIYDIRAYTADKHLKCDDYSFGGGSGMVMTPQPIYDCVQAADPDRTALRLYMSPRGKVLSQKTVRELAQYAHILLLCGHYEGVDQRVLDMCFDGELSIGDYVLTGGEIPAMAVIDAVARYVPGVLGNEASAEDESFSDGLLEYPQYTRPQAFKGAGVPEILLSGHHANVQKWRHEQSLAVTKKNRPRLYAAYKRKHPDGG
ncbi:MAG: tRNA (guanosine(37)-N1)-methyltransferase TrmD [Clostridiales bacterium]|jgi:tRNA (guanine37-N1)-methyltransferase|nr:tRNA (guanosine(37)-N1)-methyltransferase TrmD [Clostridiales bacterium]